MAGVHGGRFGVVDGVSQVRNWQINDDGNLARGVNSASKMGSFRRKGTAAWAGGYSAHGAVSGVMPSELFGFLGYTAPDNDTAGGAGQTYAGDAIVDSLGITWNWAGGNVIEHQIGFSGHLGLTAAAADAAVLDATISDPEVIGVCKITRSVDGSTWVEIENITQASLNIQAANAAYINSSTASNTGRVPGPIDWTASIGVEDNLLGSGLSKFSDYYFRFYVTASTFYELKWGTVKSFSGLQISRETQQVIAHTINIEMNGTKNVSSVLTAGHILLPGGATWWPF